MYTRALAIFVLTAILVACGSSSTKNASAKNNCPLTEPVWIKPPADSAVMNPPEFGYYFVNEDRSIWASAYQGENSLHAGEDGNKVGWFRPAEAELVITGKRLDADAPPLKLDLPCCYPTRFQASGLYFPTEGCWEINAKAEDHELTFVVLVEP